MIQPKDKILAAVGCVWPVVGGTNTLILLTVEGADGTLRHESLQPHEWSAEMLALFDSSRAANDAMVSAVCKATGAANALPR